MEPLELLFLQAHEEPFASIQSFISGHGVSLIRPYFRWGLQSSIVIGHISTQQSSLDEATKEK